MDRRNLLKGLLAIGIAAPLVKPTIEEIKEVPLEPIQKNPEFIIKGRDLEKVLNEPYYGEQVNLFQKEQLIAQGGNISIHFEKPPKLDVTSINDIREGRGRQFIDGPQPTPIISFYVNSKDQEKLNKSFTANNIPYKLIVYDNGQKLISEVLISNIETDIKLESVMTQKVILIGNGEVHIEIEDV